MRQLTRQDASFLYADTVHANANVTFVQIYDQRTAPGGKVRFKSILAHIESRLHRSPIFRSRLRRVPLELDEPYWVEDEHCERLEYRILVDHLQGLVGHSRLRWVLTIAMLAPPVSGQM